MPTFESPTGHEVWLPAQAVLRVEPTETGLTSRIHTFAPPGSPPGSTMVTEVKGRVRTIGDVLDAELRGQTPALVSV